MIAVAMDAGGSKAKLTAFTAAYAFPVARLAETRMPRSAIPGALPRTRIYGRDGALRYDSATTKVGALDTATIERVLAPLLADK